MNFVANQPAFKPYPDFYNPNYDTFLVHAEGFDWYLEKVPSIRKENWALWKWNGKDTNEIITTFIITKRTEITIPETVKHRLRILKLQGVIA